MSDLVYHLRKGVRRADVSKPNNDRAERQLAHAAADEIERLQDVLLGIETLTATGDGLNPDECISVHILAAEGRSSDPQAWRADPAVIDGLRAALKVHNKEQS